MAHLRELEVGVHPGCWEHIHAKTDSHGLDFRLSQGLRYLSNLKWLEKLTYDKIPQKMTSADVRFIAKSWLHLRQISWKLHVDETKAAPLRPILFRAFPHININELYEEYELYGQEYENDDDEWEDLSEDEEEEEEEYEHQKAKIGPASREERMVERTIALSLPQPLITGLISPVSTNTRTIRTRSSTKPTSTACQFRCGICEDCSEDRFAPPK